MTHCPLRTLPSPRLRRTHRTLQFRPAKISVDSCAVRAVAGGFYRSSLCQANPNPLELLFGAKADSWLVQLNEANARSNLRFIAFTIALLSVAILPKAIATTPQYQIYDVGVIDVGDTASQGFGVSDGGIAVGRSIRTGGSQAFTWTLNGGIVGLPNLAGRNHAVSNSANDNGVVVGLPPPHFSAPAGCR